MDQINPACGLQAREFWSKLEDYSAVYVEFVSCQGRTQQNDSVRVWKSAGTKPQNIGAHVRELAIWRALAMYANAGGDLEELGRRVTAMAPSLPRPGWSDLGFSLIALSPDYEWGHEYHFLHEGRGEVLCWIEGRQFQDFSIEDYLDTCDALDAEDDDAD